VRGFVVGLVIGAAAGAGAVLLLTRERGRSAAGVQAAAADAGVVARRTKKPRGGGNTRGPGEPGDEPAPVLGPADLKMVAEGDSLARGPVEMDLGSEGGARELTQGDIDGAMAGASDAIGECIVSATGAAELSGRVNAGVVVGPDGRVTQTRVEAPAYLMRRGLGGCVRARLRGLRFPATGKESVVKYPFTVG